MRTETYPDRQRLGEWAGANPSTAAEAVPRRVRLVVESAGEAWGEAIEADRDPFVIGGQRGCDLRVLSPHVAGRQCSVYRRDGRVFVKDLSGVGLTVLNGRPLLGSRKLRGGDLLRVGPLAVRVAIDGTPPPAVRPGEFRQTLALVRDGGGHALLVMGGDDRSAGSGEKEFRV